MIVTHISTDAFRGVTELTLLAPNHPRLLAMVAGACTGAGANIADAQISTTRDGMALDTIHLEREFDHAEDEERRARKIAVSIERMLKGEIAVVEVIKAKVPKRFAPVCLLRRAAGDYRQHAVRRADGDRDQRSRPARPAL